MAGCSEAVEDELFALACEHFALRGGGVLGAGERGGLGERGLGGSGLGGGYMFFCNFTHYCTIVVFLGQSVQ